MIKVRRGMLVTKPTITMLEWAKAIHEALGIESPSIFIATFGLVGLLLFAGAGWIVDRGYRARVREMAAVSPPREASPVRVFVPHDVDVEYLAGLYDTNMAIQADALAKVYIGKWMNVSGQLENVRDYGGKIGGVAVSITIPKHQPKTIPMLVTLRFDRTWRDRLVLLRKRSDVVAFGMIESVGSRGPSLVRCELGQP